VRIFLFILVAAIASLSSFLVHLVTVEWLPTWIGMQMQGLQTHPSWDVRYIAGVTTIIRRQLTWPVRDN